MWCCTILPSRFQFKFEKMKPQWTSKRSVPTLTGEGINTHTQEARNTSLVPPELKNKHRVRSFFSPKESIYRVKNLKHVTEHLLFGWTFTYYCWSRRMVGREAIIVNPSPSNLWGTCGDLTTQECTLSTLYYIDIYPKLAIGYILPYSIT